MRPTLQLLATPSWPSATPSVLFLNATEAPGFLLLALAMCASHHGDGGGQCLMLARGEAPRGTWLLCPASWHPPLTSPSWGTPYQHQLRRGLLMVGPTSIPYLHVIMHLFMSSCKIDRLDVIACAVLFVL